MTPLKRYLRLCSVRPAEVRIFLVEHYGNRDTKCDWHRRSMWKPYVKTNKTDYIDAEAIALRLWHGRRCVSCRSRPMTSWICSPGIACASAGRCVARQSSTDSQLSCSDVALLYGRDGTTWMPLYH